jgi:uncharacterized membrane protein YedE/YeeE
MESLFPAGIGHYLAGGLLIGAGVSLLYVSTGLVGGVSTFYTAAWSWLSRAAFFSQPRFVATRGWRVAYMAGLAAGAALWWLLLAGGFVAGFGARLANGCTSGHGICGLASLQLPSLLAVLAFLATAIVTARLVAAWGLA